MEQTTGTPLYYVDEDCTAKLKYNNLSRNEAIGLAHNGPLWRLISALLYSLCYTFLVVHARNDDDDDGGSLELTCHWIKWLRVYPAKINSRPVLTDDADCCHCRSQRADCSLYKTKDWKNPFSQAGFKSYPGSVTT